MKIVVIGGNAAGMSAASKIKRSLPNSEIIVLEKTMETSYGACGLPYYISDINDDIDKVRIRKPDAFKKNGIDIRLKKEVIGIDENKNNVKVLDLNTNNVTKIKYDKLIITSGSSPIIPKISGVDKKGVFKLKTIEDAINIKEYALKEDIKDVIIVGAGYIGMELVESFERLGKKVRVIEKLDRPMTLLDEDFSNLIVKELRENKIQLNMNETVEEFSGTEILEHVITDKGKYKADLAVVCVGTMPNTKFLKGSNIKLWRNGSIIVNEKMETNIDNIYSAGDCATIKNRITGKDTYLPLGTNSNKQGKILGEIIIGENKKLDGVLGTSMCRIINLEVAKTGIDNKEAEVAGLSCNSVYIESNTKPPYFPGGENLHVKLFYNDKNGKILGAQLAGKEGAASRIGMCAIAIQNGMTCSEFALADLGYAPPFTYVWDPVQIAAGLVK